MSRGAIAILLLCIACSILGVVYAAAVSQIATDGQRGGAVGVALSLVFGFLSLRVTTRLLEADIPPGEELKTDAANATEALASNKSVDTEKLNDYLATIRADLNHIKNAMATQIDEQRQDRWAFAIASLTSTFFWGFGDVLARCFGAT